MRKAVIGRFGGPEVIQIIDAATPSLSRNQVLVKVQAAALNPKDVLIRKGKFRNFTGKKFPLSIGFDFAGVIDKSTQSAFKKGDKVFGMVNGWKGRCCAEYLNVNADQLFFLPDHLSFVEGAGIPLAGQTALQSIRDLGRLNKGQKICINGASGGVGTLAIQIAQTLEGVVTTISSDRNLNLCRKLGANETLSYIDTNILKKGDLFDIFFDVFGNYSFKKTSSILTKKGIYITTVPSGEILVEQAMNVFRCKKAKMVVVKSKISDLKWLHEKLSSSDIIPIIDRVFPLSEIQDAQSYIESKRARGKVVLNLAH